MSTFTGMELDVRFAGATGLDCAAFAPDHNDFPELDKSGPAQFLRDVLDYILWQRIPPGSRVICSVAIPDYQGNSDSMMAMLDDEGMGVPAEVESAGIEAVMNWVVENAPGGWGE